MLVYFIWLADLSLLLRCDLSWRLSAISLWLLVLSFDLYEASAKSVAAVPLVLVVAPFPKLNFVPLFLLFSR